MARNRNPRVDGGITSSNGMANVESTYRNMEHLKPTVGPAKKAPVQSVIKIVDPKIRDEARGVQRISGPAKRIAQTEANRNEMGARAKALSLAKQAQVESNKEAAKRVKKLT